MKLRIVSVNDVYILDNLPRLRTLVRHYGETDPADALLVTLAGDFLSPSILSSLDGGRAMVDCLNMVGVTHVTYGNHEDDLPTDELLARMRELRATWLSTNVRELDPSLPVSDVLEVSGICVGLVGAVMIDPAVYRRRPFGGETMVDASTAVLAETERLVKEEGCAFVIPLTHQFVEADRLLAAAQAQRGSAFPVICGGHEHQSMLENVAGTWIVKAKMDAVTAGIIDVTFEGGEARATARIEAVAAYEPDAELEAKVVGYVERLRELEQATLLTLPPGVRLSSIGSRAHQTSLGTLLASRMRDSLEADGALFNGGGIRASREYEGRFTYGALKAEVPFDNEIVVVQMPGRVVAAAIAASRARAPIEFGGFLQVDDRMQVEEPGHRLVTLGGAPLDPERDYAIALVRSFLFGLDDIAPLVRFAKEQPSRVPPVDSGRDVRLILSSAFAVELWRSLGGFDAVDTNHDDEVTLSEVAAALAHLPGQDRPDITAGLIVSALDTNHDHVITRDEAEQVE